MINYNYKLLFNVKDVHLDLGKICLDIAIILPFCVILFILFVWIPILKNLNFFENCQKIKNLIVSITAVFPNFKIYLAERKRITKRSLFFGALIFIFAISLFWHFCILQPYSQKELIDNINRRIKNNDLYTVVGPIDKFIKGDESKDKGGVESFRVKGILFHYRSRIGCIKPIIDIGQFASYRHNLQEGKLYRISYFPCYIYETNNLILKIEELVEMHENGL